MPESLARKISLSFISIIFAEGHIMNSPFVAIVPLYALVVLRQMKPVSGAVRWLYKVEACIIIQMSLYVLLHITAWIQGRPLLPALRNSGRFLTIEWFVFLFTYSNMVESIEWALVATKSNKVMLPG